MLLGGCDCGAFSGSCAGMVNLNLDAGSATGIAPDDEQK